ncbi:hypothetical protein ACIRU8_39020 [Streptomyces sp. NPDC101175]|uniref:hypothetical protein n=1 Tax=Streptomyces sp. NPDC101175 TaxID=3366123 RepID=UPI0038368FC5
MNAQLFGPVSLDLNDGPVRAEYGLSPVDGTPTARLVIGDLSQSIGISVTKAGPEMVAELAAVAAELADWARRQKQLQNLPEVA